MMNVVTRRWLIKTARSNLWRVAYYYEFDDLLQDGMLCYARIHQKYPAAEPRQHTRLFQRTFINHIHNLANKRTRDVSAFPIDTISEDSVPACEYADLLRLVMEAPSNIKKVLIKILVDYGWPEHRIRHDGTRETTNERLCRLIARNPMQVNMHADLLTYLQEK